MQLQQMYSDLLLLVYSQNQRRVLDRGPVALGRLPVVKLRHRPHSTVHLNRSRSVPVFLQFPLPARIAVPHSACCDDLTPPRTTCRLRQISMVEAQSDRVPTTSLNRTRKKEHRFRTDNRQETFPHCKSQMLLALRWQNISSSEGSTDVFLLCNITFFLRRYAAVRILLSPASGSSQTVYLVAPRRHLPG